jgi:hypothetical protein
MRSVRAAALLIVVVIVYASVLLWPHRLFAYSVEDRGIVLHSRAALPAVTSAILEDARSRVARSPLYKAGEPYDLFLCDTTGLFSFFTLWNRNAGGVTNWALTGNIFLRPAHVDRNRLVGPSGREAADERTLAYFIAHEMMHTLVARSIGRVRYARLERWQTEGYADYVAKAGGFDYEANLRAFRAGDIALDPARSGLYRRYHLLVASLLDGRHMTVDALLAEPIPQASVEAALR